MDSLQAAVDQLEESTRRAIRRGGFLDRDFAVNGDGNADL
jgi:hypothetical protein